MSGYGTLDLRLAYKEAKTERSRRTIALPATFVQELKAHRKASRTLPQAWRQPVRARIPDMDGMLMNPRHFTKAFNRRWWLRKFPTSRFMGCGTRTSLICSGVVAVHVVSERARHANPTVTLNIYAHLLPGQQERRILSTACDPVVERHL
jgi:hypothetical protein